MKKRKPRTIPGGQFSAGAVPDAASSSNNINTHTGREGEPFTAENGSQPRTEPFTAGAVPGDVLSIFHNTIEQLRVLYNEGKRKKIIITELAQCLRASFYYVQYGKEITDKLLLGADKHDWTQRHMVDLLKDKLSCESEYKVEWKSISGRIDLLCRDSSNNVYVVELKFSSNPTSSNVFLPWYVRQLKYYSAIMALNENKEVYGILLVLSYNYETYYIKSITINPIEAKEIVKEMEQRAYTLASAKSSFAPPPREKGNWCGLCTFRSICFNEKLV